MIEWSVEQKESRWQGIESRCWDSGWDRVFLGPPSVDYTRNAI